jgi:zinc transport system permease protein
VLSSLEHWLDDGILWFTTQMPVNSFWSIQFNVRALLAILLVSLICGSVGSMVVGNRMAFFSDALAHCAFAGVALGLLLALVTGAQKEDFKSWIGLIMVAFGVVIGLGIARVREKTSLASDTVIGVFFAGAIGLGAVFMKAVSGRARYFNLENFLFGNPLDATSGDILVLLVLLVPTAVFLFFLYNSLVFTSFNPSLARSRRVPTRLCNYLFIALLGVIVNLCLQVAGALLINALLIVPAATAANLSRNMRQLFWLSTLMCVFVGLGGQFLHWEIRVPEPGTNNVIQFGLSGITVVLSVILFFFSMLIKPAMERALLRINPALQYSESLPKMTLQDETSEPPAS